MAELRGDPRWADWSDLRGRTVVVEGASQDELYLRVVGSERVYRVTLGEGGGYDTEESWVPHPEMSLEVSGP